MKFEYPYKAYFFGLLFTIILISYGCLIMYQIVFIEENSLLMGYIYIALSAIIIYWYIVKIFYYKSRYIMISKDYIEIIFDNKKIYIPSNNIYKIIVANHQQLLKIYNVTHLFTYDGEYFYFTNEMSAYLTFNKVLFETFNEKFMVRKRLIKGYPIHTKDLLLSNKD